MSSGDVGGWESWQWDETLFAGAASHYVQGRTPYALGLADGLVETLGLDGKGRLLDIGCGPGVITLGLAHRFEYAVGLDPDPGMRAVALRLAEERAVANVSWVLMRAEDLPADLGAFRVVTFAASFHWMGRPRVARAVRSMLETGGAVVQIDAPAGRETKPDFTLPHPSPPYEAIGALRVRYLGPDRRAGRSMRNASPDGEDVVFQAAGFAPAQRVMVSDGRTLERTADDIVANAFSSSSSTPPRRCGLRNPNRIPV